MSKRQQPLSQGMALAQVSGLGPVCPLCARNIPRSQADKHHLVPRLKGGKDTVVLHRVCHRQVHALFTEAQLARDYNTVEKLLNNPDVQKFAAWVRFKPIDFYAPIRRSKGKTY